MDWALYLVALQKAPAQDLRICYLAQHFRSVLNMYYVCIVQYALCIFIYLYHTHPSFSHSKVTLHVEKFSECLSSWTTLVVNSRDVEDCGGAPQRKSTLKPAKITYITMWQYWLGNTKSKKAFRLILNPFKKLLQNFLKKSFTKQNFLLTN